jgi:hypothetical protein
MPKTEICSRSSGKGQNAEPSSVASKTRPGLAPRTAAAAVGIRSRASARWALTSTPRRRAAGSYVWGMTSMVPAAVTSGLICTE